MDQHVRPSLDAVRYEKIGRTKREQLCACIYNMLVLDFGCGLFNIISAKLCEDVHLSLIHI